ncbi:MAG: Vms1/Ankzf1 family peptidyl-tRNA hydrolase, partial [Nocardioides sp.]
QGRTKAGGQSQQRFARRRANQARQAYEAAADHAARILAGLDGPLAVGGDRGAVEEVLADPRLRHLHPDDAWLPVPDPRRGVLEQAVRDSLSVRVEVTNAPGSGAEES